uniref:Uncharacterized protein n=1 Tax=Astyanax mexicanus TaxID=7994 RepID=A0A3B1IH09_ASTMX
LSCTQRYKSLSQETHPEVVGIHVQFLGVQNTELSVGRLDVVHVLHSSIQTVEDNCTVSGNLGVSHDGSGVVQVSKIAEVPLGPGLIPCQGIVSNGFVIHLGKDVLDGSALEIGPLNHGADFEVSTCPVEEESCKLSVLSHTLYIRTCAPPKPQGFVSKDMGWVSWWVG